MTREDVIRQIVKRDIGKQPLTAERVAEQANELYAAACEHFGTWDTALQYAGVRRRNVYANSAARRSVLLTRIRKLFYCGNNISAGRVAARRPGLFNAAKKHFGSWRSALIAAQIDPRQVRRPSKRRRLNHQQIIDALKRRHAAGKSMTWGDTCREDRALATAAKHHFRSWQRALIAADLETPQPLPGKKTKSARRCWSQDRVVAAIQQRHREGKSLSSYRVHADDASLTAAAIRQFGSWNAALAAAGIDRNVPPPGRDDAP
ncbi:MAG: hypothetical protein WD875_09430 [Pirellulales bacterium]